MGEILKNSSAFCLILTGMSGAGKTVALKNLEDFGFNCIDNLPVGLLDKFIELFMQSNQGERIALGIDSRNIQELDQLEEHLLFWEEEAQIRFQIVFLDARDEVLIQRFKGKRRKNRSGDRFGKEKACFLAEEGGHPHRYFQTFNTGSSATVVFHFHGRQSI